MATPTTPPGSEAPADDIKRLAKMVKTRLMTEKRIDSTGEDELKAICDAAKGAFQKEPSLLELKAPITIVGDTHGQFHDLLRLINFCGNPTQEKPYLFLGDYVDRGKFGVECITYLFTLKLLYPNNVYLIRGNHECASINRIYGFYQEVRRRYSIRMWKEFQSVFDYLPLAARISKSILCVHGGLSPNLKTWSNLSEIQRPLKNEEEGLAADLMWADYDESGKKGWHPNTTRQLSYTFGPDVLAALCKDLNISAVIRGHEVAASGYCIDGKEGALFVTVFSAPNYLGKRENSGAALHLNSDLSFHFSIMHPKQANDQDTVSISSIRGDPLAELKRLKAPSDGKSTNQLDVAFRREGLAGEIVPLIAALLQRYKPPIPQVSKTQASNGASRRKTSCTRHRIKLADI